MNAILQRLVELNLGELFGLEFIRGSLNSEFSIKGTYFDTLAFDPQANAFVIIEYKRDKNFSVIDQGYTYLSALVNNKAEFLREYQEQRNKKLSRVDVDWTQTRVIFISREFTPYQKGAIGFKDIPFELWEAQLFENHLCTLTQVKSAETQESISKFTKSSTIEDVSKDVRTFTFEDHYNRGSPDIKDLLSELRTRILALDEHVKEKPVQTYLGYKLNWYNFTAVHVFRDRLKVFVRVEKLENDTEHRFMRMSASEKHTPLSWIEISKSGELDYVMRAIEESYKKAPDR